MHPVLHHLVDDAAIFPPGNAELGRAVREHERHRSSAYAALVGPLLVRDVDIARLTARPWEIGVVVTGSSDLAALPWDGVAAVEIPIAGDDLPAAAAEIVRRLAIVPDGVTVSVELPRPDGPIPAAWIAAADEIGAAGFQVKLRTGGTVASAHPAEAELAAMLEALVARRHRVKLTAGLHRAVRNRQTGTGFEQHGFLNVLVAVHRLLGGGTAQDAAQGLADRDGPALASVVGEWDAEDAGAVRQTFRGFGSCSITEPYADLVDLGLAA